MNIIDIRERYEILPTDRALMPHAKHIPLGDVWRDIQHWDKSVSYLLICEHGIRSKKLLKAMRNMGFTQVEHYAGGYARLRKGAGLAKNYTER